MDLFLPIVLFIVFCVLFSICGWCCKKHREGTIYGVPATTVTVTQQPGSHNIPPYPVDPRHQQQIAPVGYAPTSGYQSGPYPVTSISPYPPAPAGGYPPVTPYPAAYPPANVTPYPPAPTTQNYSQLPPSYTEAVGQPPSQPRPPLNEGKPEERSVLYKRSTSLQHQNTQSQSSPVTQTFRCSLSESRSPYPQQTTPYPVNITPYPPKPPPIGFGLMPAYEASTSIVYPMMHQPPRHDLPASINTFNEANTDIIVQPPYPSFNAVPYPPPLPPTYDEAMRHSAYLGK